MTHICVSKLTISSSDNGLSPGRRQILTCTNSGILLFEHSGTNYSDILIEMHAYSCKKMHLKISSGKLKFCIGLHVWIQAMAKQQFIVKQLPEPVLTYFDGTTREKRKWNQKIEQKFSFKKIHGEINSCYTGYQFGPTMLCTAINVVSSMLKLIQCFPYNDEGHLVIKSRAAFIIGNWTRNVHQAMCHILQFNLRNGANIYRPDFPVITMILNSLTLS